MQNFENLIGLSVYAHKPIIRCCVRFVRAVHYAPVARYNNPHHFRCKFHQQLD
jgi:hypothetical protein